MKKILVGVVVFAICMVGGHSDTFAALDYPIREGETILTQNHDDVVGREVNEADDPLRDGAASLGEGIGDASDGENIFYDEIETTGEAWEETTRVIKGLINWALGIIGLVALVYLIYHGLIAVTAGGDEEKLKKGMGGVKYALIAIFGIALAWFFVSLVFWLITLLTT